MVKTYPSRYQAAIRLKLSALKLKGLKDLCPKPLFVYGSLMMLQLGNDVYLEESESLFLRHLYSEVKIYMCPAKAPEYARLSINRSHEPIMMHRKIGDCVSGMLIWGLSDESYRILDRYLSNDFVKQHIELPQAFVKQDVQASVKVGYEDLVITAQAYVWPHGVYDNRGKPDVEWTVEGFWQKAPVCQSWRETMDENFPNRMLDIKEEVQRIAMENEQELEELGTKVTDQQYIWEQASTQEQIRRNEVAPLQTATWEGAEPPTSMAAQNLNMRDAGIAAEQETFQQWVTTQEEAGWHTTMATQNFGMLDASIAAALDTDAWDGYGPATQSFGALDTSTATTWNSDIRNGYGPPGPWSNTSPYMDQATASVGRQEHQHFRT